MKLAVARSKIRFFLPFVIIVVAAVLLLERQKHPPFQQNPPLPPPQISIDALDVRSDTRWDFVLPEFSGEMVHLCDFAGQVVLLNFFGTWCAPCREEMPSLEQAFQTHKDRGFVVLGIAGDKEKETIVSFVEDFKLTFPILLDPKNQVSQQYFVRGIPVSYLLDRQGRIATMYPGGADWNSKEARILIKHLLQDPSEEH